MYNIDFEALRKHCSIKQ